MLEHRRDRLPLVSVIIPTYNHRAFILSAIESVFAQTLKDFELIVINDGSPDDTAELLRAHSESGRIRYIEQPNAGQAAARNLGLTLARGRFVAFLDDDDLWPPDKLEWQVDELEDQPQLSAVGGSVAIIDATGAELRRVPLSAGAVTFESLFDGNPFFSPGQTLIRTECLRAIGGFDTSIWGADDFDAWFRLCRTGKIASVDRLALLYRLHASNASRDLNRMFYQGLSVIRRHAVAAPAETRRGLMIRGYRFVYAHAFSGILSAAKTGLKHGRFREILQLPGPMLRLAPQSMSDTQLLVWFLRDLLPNKWVRKNS